MIVICPQCGCEQDDPTGGEDHYLTCPRILTPAVMAMLGFNPKKGGGHMATKKTSKKPVKTTKKH